MLLVMIHQSVDRIYTDYDKNKDGYLTLEGAQDFIRDSFGQTMKGGTTEANIQDLFNRIDTDNNGKINKGELAMFILALTKF